MTPDEIKDKAARLLPMPERRCWLCGKNGSADPLDRHHIFGAANRGEAMEENGWSTEDFIREFGRNYLEG